jgi:hypothetical protein
MTSPLVPLASNDLLYRAQVGRADHSTPGRARDQFTYFHHTIIFVARDGGHLDDMPNMLVCCFQKAARYNV